ncbi:hypothetical protein [Paraburkholderia oxyphila]|uniref:hypothetical protein n=1 Tax=Paraburkholderia oxyphila TaxID=614212 RepID=UPI000485E821|nr:hypothetical protein [Paraburkholderia oxyphila]
MDAKAAVENIVTGICILLLLVTWRYALRPAILGCFRDQLFDLRDEIREHFVHEPGGLSRPIYGNLRTLINSYLRFAENFNLPQFLLIERSIKKNQGLVDVIAKQVDKSFHSTLSADQKYAADIRRRAGRIMMRYALASSGLVAPIAILVVVPILAVFVCTGYLCEFVGKKATLSARYLFSRLRESVRDYSDQFANKLMDAEVVEAYAYQSATETSQESKLAST